MSSVPQNRDFEQMTTRTDRIDARLTPVEPAVELLPYWTRATNPIVRRHLGLYWRTLPPQVRPLLKVFAVWSAVLLIGSLLQNILYVTLLVVIVSVVVLPIATLVYGHILLSIAMTAADTMQAEQRNDTLHLLMATPMSLEQILLGKVAAAIWKRMEDWILITWVVVIAAPPLLFSMYMPLWDVPGHPLVLPVAVIGATAVALLRLVLEPLMVGMIAVYIGAVVPYRSTAISVSVAVSLAYFTLMWLVTQLPIIHGTTLRDGTLIAPNYFLVVLFDLILPILLPALITWGMLRLTVRTLRQD